MGRLRQRQTLKDIREEGLSLEMQLYVADQEDYKFTRAVLAALQVNIEDARAGREAALREAHQSNLDCTAAQEASKHSNCFCTSDLAHLCMYISHNSLSGSCI